jgi:hypothetical protein
MVKLLTPEQPQEISVSYDRIGQVVEPALVEPPLKHSRSGGRRLKRKDSEPPAPSRTRARTTPPVRAT